MCGDSRRKTSRGTSLWDLRSSRWLLHHAGHRDTSSAHPSLPVARPAIVTWARVQRELRRGEDWAAHRILTVSKLWVTVTAPHAAMPPAMKELLTDQRDVPRSARHLRLTPEWWTWLLRALCFPSTPENRMKLNATRQAVLRRELARNWEVFDGEVLAKGGGDIVCLRNIRR